MENLPEPGDRYFTAVLEVIGDSINNIAKNEDEQTFYSSLVTAGNHAAACVVTYCGAMKDLYGEGSAIKSLEMTRLFTLLMLAQSYRWLNQQSEQAVESEESARIAAANVLSIFGDEGDHNIELFLKLKIQFDHDSVHHSSMTHMGGLMLGWAAEAMGHKCIDWENIKFPVQSMGTLTTSGALLDSTPIRNPNDIDALWVCHNLGCKKLMEHYEEKNIENNTSTNNPESD